MISHVELKIVKLIEAEVEWWLPGVSGSMGGDGQMLVKGYNVSVVQDE